MDLKFLGYFISTISVIMLGVAAWPGPDEPQYKTWVVLGGSIASVLGMGVRYLSHRHEKMDVKRASLDLQPKHQ